MMVGDVVFNIGSDLDEVEKLNISNSTGMQSFYAKGMFGEIYDESFKDLLPWYGTTAFASEDKHGTNYSDYEGSIVEGYVNDYKTKLESKFDINVVEARLITGDELTDSDTFACSIDDFSCFNSTYPWIYSTSYWIDSFVNDNIVRFVLNTGSIYEFLFTLGSHVGVRPVIVLPKSYFE